jgi:hypothetical protein
MNIQFVGIGKSQFAVDTGSIAPPVERGKGHWAFLPSEHREASRSGTSTLGYPVKDPEEQATCLVSIDSFRDRIRYPFLSFFARIVLGDIEQYLQRNTMTRKDLSIKIIAATRA